MGDNEISVAAPPCPGCGRPLQRDRETCIYCGRALTEEDLEKVREALDDETVERQVQYVEAMLQSAGSASSGRAGKIVGRILVVVLSLLAALLISWIGQWNPLITVVAVMFFALPVWMVFRRT